MPHGNARIWSIGPTGDRGPQGSPGPGRFLHVILKCPIGTATATQIIRGTVVIDGYFE